MFPSVRHCAAVFVIFSALGILRAQTTLLAPLDLTRGKPFVMVSINGKGPFRFILDTGTGAEAVITPALAAQLELPVAGQVRLSDPSGQGGQTVPIFLIQSLRVAGVEFMGVAALRHAMSDADGYCQGLLGFLLFRDYLLTVDYPRQRMTLHTGDLKPDGEQSVLPFRMPYGVPIVPLRIGALQVEAQIDSWGSGFSVPDALVSRLKFVSDPVVFGSGESLSTSFQIRAGKLASDLRLGTYTFKRPFVEINSAFPLANFGSCPLQYFAITFDQKNGLVSFKSAQKTFHLAATPAAMHLKDVPKAKPRDPSIVPVG
jgi:Aspartyl protease